jgi:hypothetical protein
MPAQGQQPPAQTNNSASPSYEELVRKVAQRVWELWQQDLRREHERRGRTGKR